MNLVCTHIQQCLQYERPSYWYPHICVYCVVLFRLGFARFIF